VLDDFGGSLRPAIRARIPEAVDLAVRELEAWGFRARRREPGEVFAPLNDAALRLEAYEGNRPSAEHACRVGDPRVLARVGVGGET